DDSMGYQYPFTLRVVGKDGNSCAWCPWYSLDSCLKAFTSEEELGEDELYYCSKCKTHRLATKKLDLWRLPPILVSESQALKDLEHRSLHSRSESEDLLRVGEDNLSSISAPAGFCNLPKGTSSKFRKLSL
ncbi:hypothetical protein XENOCAPTIV_025038, partial [Xenoophorus captivus]